MLQTDERKLTRTKRQSSGIGSVWWLRPANLAIAWLVTVVVAAFAVSEATYAADWGLRKNIDAVRLGGLLLAIGALALGSATTTARTRTRTAHRQQHSDLVMRRAFRLAIRLTLLAYVIWFAAAISNGLNVGSVTGSLSLEAGQASANRAAFQTIPGLTTFTQLGPPAAVLGIILRSRSTAKQERRTIASLLLLLAAAVLLRGLLNSERLAIIEMAAATAIGFAFAEDGGGGWLVRHRNWLPMAMPAFLLVGFTASEIPRSFSAKGVDISSPSVFEAGASRLAGYYASSLNNEGLLLPGSSDRWSDAPIHSMAWFWDMPGVNAVWGYSQYSGGIEREAAWRNLLRTSANPDLNTPGGILAFVVDYGWPVGIALTLLMGMSFGNVYTKAMRREIWAIVAYPVVLVTLLELPRHLYLTLGRTFPWLLFAFALRAAPILRSKHRARR